MPPLSLIPLIGKCSQMFTDVQFSTMAADKKLDSHMQMPVGGKKHYFVTTAKWWYLSLAFFYFYHHAPKNLSKLTTTELMSDQFTDRARKLKGLVDTVLPIEEANNWIWAQMWKQLEVSHLQHNSKVPLWFSLLTQNCSELCLMARNASNTSDCIPMWHYFVSMFPSDDKQCKI